MKQRFYFDDEEEGLSYQTSHPNFASLLKEDFYLDCLDEFSPFGNDDGAEVFMELQDWYVEKKGKNSILKWLYAYIDEFGFAYQSKQASLLIELEDINFLLENDKFFIDCMDKVIIAVAFGQYKIQGTIDKKLKEIALIAIKRQELITKQAISTHYFDTSKLLKVVDGISTRPDENGETTTISSIYLERLALMHSHLEQFLTTN